MNPHSVSAMPHCEDIGSIERPFNPHRAPASDRARGFIHAIVAEIEARETRRRLRTRKRRPDARATFIAATGAVVSDIAVNAMREGCSGVHLSRSHRHIGVRTRYDHPANTRQLTHILDTLHVGEDPIIGQRLGSEGQNGEAGHRSLIWAGSKFLEWVDEAGLHADDFRTLPMGETVILKRPKCDFWDHGGLQEYQDDATTEAFRRQLSEINDRLAGADLSLSSGYEESTDSTDRQLRRVFTQGRFDSGGRMFGGFWQPMRKDDRMKFVRIDGERTVEVDYGQIMPRLAYALCDATPSMRDLYAIPGFEDCRAGIKTVFCSMLFNNDRIARMPRGTRELFPGHVKVGEVVDAIQSAHPGIQPMFFSGVGHHCQFLESEILVHVLLRLNGQGITALPIHDAVLVPASAADVTQQVMLEVFREQTGTDGVVEVVGR